jgi:hypothetical protein
MDATPTPTMPDVKATSTVAPSIEGPAMVPRGRGRAWKALVLVKSSQKESVNAGAESKKRASHRIMVKNRLVEAALAQQRVNCLGTHRRCSGRRQH